MPLDPVSKDIVKLLSIAGNTENYGSQQKSRRNCVPTAV